MAGIFVSYRRSDTQGEAGRLFDDLVKHFGEETVFMDVAAIEAGRDFRKAIEEGVTKCGVLLVVIGPSWVNAKDEAGILRLNDASDFVRIETSSALRRDIPVIPVLVRGAKMPSAEQLPEDLRELAYRNCIELTHARWRSDIQLLVDALRKVVDDPTGAGANSQDQAGASAKKVSGPTTLTTQGTGKIDPAVIPRISHELALYIGPIADIVVKRAAAQSSSVEDLYSKVAAEIDSASERAKFLQGRGVNQETPPARSPQPVSSPSPAVPSPIAASAPKETPIGAGTQRREIPAPTSSSKWGLIAGAVILLVIVVAGALYMRQKEESVPTAARVPAAATNTTESAPEKAVVVPPTQPAAPAPTQTEPEAKKTETAKAPTLRSVKESQPKGAQPVRISEEVLQDLLLSKVQPVYPPLAQQARIKGIVVLDVDISKDGTIESVRALRGHPLLVPAAIDAVRQWRYKPFLLNGEPVPINTQISVVFSLSN